MSKLELIASDAAARFVEKSQEDDPGFQFDPAIIMIFADILMQLFEALQDCRDDNQDEVVFVHKAANSPSRWQKLLLRIKVRRELGWREYRRHGRDMVKSILETGDNLTVEDVDELLEEF